MFLNKQSNREEISETARKAEFDRPDGAANVTPIALGLESQIDYPILNFFAGSVRTDRIEYENSSRRAGLAHWKGNRRDSASYADQVMHAGFAPAQANGNQAQRSTGGYGASSQSPGMGLEGENLQSFITGSHLMAIPTAAPRQIEQRQQEPLQEPLQEQPESNQSVPEKNHTELPSGAPAPAIVFKFRRMKTTTFHNLLAMAMNE